MPQLVLPIFPEGSTEITPLLSVKKADGLVTYFHGALPVFVHDEKDTASFRMITAQLCVNGSATQAQIRKAFGVTKPLVMRAVKLYRERGPGGFYAPRRRRGAAVLTPPVLAAAQDKLDAGLTTSEVAGQLDLKRDTLRGAIRAGRLHRPAKKGGPQTVGVNQQRARRANAV